MVQSTRYSASMMSCGNCGQVPDKGRGRGASVGDGWLGKEACRIRYLFGNAIPKIRLVEHHLHSVGAGVRPLLPSALAPHLRSGMHCLHMQQHLHVESEFLLHTQC